MQIFVKDLQKKHNPGGLCWRSRSEGFGERYLSIISQWPALVLPSRIRMPFFCRSARSRSIVLLTTDKTTDICCAEMNGFFLINSSISCCLSVSLTGDILVTELVTLDILITPRLFVLNVLVLVIHCSSFFLSGYLFAILCLGHLPVIARWISQHKTKTILTTVLTQLVCHNLSYFLLHASSVQRYIF